MMRPPAGSPRGAGVLLALAALLLPSVATAAPQPRRAAPVSEIVVDLRRDATLYARAADERRPPASLAKLMTLYLVFDALEAGRLRLDDRLVLSSHAAAQPRSNLGMAAGATLDVRAAIGAVAVHSANDIAVALAERLAGSERRFAALMTAKARRLGLADTRFANATGLTSAGNVTTARDIARLSAALLRRHAGDYRYFGLRSITWRHRTLPNHNHLLGKVTGVDGIKTGYTLDAGYNLAASASRRGRRVLVVVLGERSLAARDTRVANLVQLAFTPAAAPRRGRQPVRGR